MGSTCKCCKGTKFVGHNAICILCAEATALCPAASEGSDEPIIPCLCEESSAENVASDCGLSRRCEQSEAPEQSMDALAQTTEPQNTGLVQATTDPVPLGRTDIGSSQGEDNPHEYDSFKPDDDPGHPEADCVVIFRSSMSGAQHERVTDHIRQIQPETAVFVAIMKQCDIQLPSPLMIISKERVVAAAARFPHENGTIILKMSGKTANWQPRFFIDKDMCTLAGNWLDFVCNNQVKKGDICIFVPTKDEGSSTFIVHLMCAEAAHPRGVKRGRSMHGTADATISSTEGPSHGGNASLENNIHGVVPPEFLDGGDAQGPSEHGGIILRYYDNLTTSQQKIVDERVQAIRSGYPLYVVQMNESHRLHRKQFEFGKQYAKAVHLPNEDRKMILCSMGKEWRATMACRKIDKKDRWFITKGWRTFARGSGVQETGLRSGDIYLFELKSMNEKEVTMEVHVIPKEQF
ncbi:unnamed protein product [Alopecurus aequalis]